MLGSAFFVTENLFKKTNKQKRKFSFVILPPPSPPPHRSYFTWTDMSYVLFLFNRLRRWL